MKKYTVSYKVNNGRTLNMKVIAASKDEARAKVEWYFDDTNDDLTIVQVR